MITSSWLKQAQADLGAAEISTARLDCLVLLEDEIGKDRAWILSHPEYELQIEIVQKLNKRITQRALHEPLAYIRGKSEFYGREFYVDGHVLVPRPESEMIIDLLKQLALPSDSVVADIGTGSGALAITAKLELPYTRVIATDIEPACLNIAKQNALKLHADIQVLQGDLLEPLSTLSDHPIVLLCNLPYVPDGFPVNQAAAHEPRTALFGGTDGLDMYRRLFGQIEALPTEPSFILTEAMPAQHEDLSKLAHIIGFILQANKDFVQVFRQA